MGSAYLLRSWHLLPCCLLLATGAMMPRGHAETTTSQLMVTVNVVNSCSFDSTTTALLAITCSMQTPVAATSGAPAGVGGTAAASTPANTVSPLHVTSKFCNFLATEQLENASFNQFSLDIAGHTAGPQSYYSTMQVCF